MKDKSFNLGKIGKQMPYRTPEGFFGELEGKIWERAKNEGIIHTASGAGTAIKAGEPSEMPGRPDNHAPGAGKQEHRRARINPALPRPALIGSAAAAVIIAFSVWFCNLQTVKMSDIESAFDSLSYEDRTYILDIYRSDIFLNWN